MGARADIGEAPAWAERWRVIAPPGAVRVDLGRGGRARHGFPQLASGAPVVLCASGLLARRTVRRAARGAGIRLEREYLALPSADQPAFLVQDRSAAVDYFRRRILTSPPGRARAWAAALALGTARLAPAGLLGAMAPGCVALGRRP
jgi:hypothetical protein